MNCDECGAWGLIETYTTCGAILFNYNGEILCERCIESKIQTKLLKYKQLSLQLAGDALKYQRLAHEIRCRE